MPNYDYECTKCGHKFEVFQQMSAAKLSECPKCKGKVKRLIGAGSGIIFKGTGFYETDYKNKKHSASQSAHNGPSCPKGCHGCH